MNARKTAWAVVWTAIVLAATAQPATAESLTERDAIKQIHAEAQQHRARAGLATQELDEECCKIAQRWAERMASTGTFSHGGGEQIIAYGYPTAAAALTGWINSSGHRAWVLGDSAKCGWGCAQRNGLWYWAGAFRDRLTIRTRSTDTTITAAATTTTTSRHRVRSRCGPRGCR